MPLTVSALLLPRDGSVPLGWIVCLGQEGVGLGDQLGSPVEMETKSGSAKL